MAPSAFPHAPADDIDLLLSGLTTFHLDIPKPAPEPTASPPQSIYTSTPLSPTAPELRLLILHPGSPPTAPRCTFTRTYLTWPITYTLLHRARLARETHALAPKTLVPITIERTTTLIPSDLLGALTTLRQPDRPVPLFVPEICVNWADAREAEEAQWAEGEVYRRAGRVAVWLDEGQWEGGDVCLEVSYRAPDARVVVWVGGVGWLDVRVPEGGGLDGDAMVQ
ncbi:hypothetical protein EJ06DRAFT_582077 [Trichodelitschia bisporula]|uniref:Uncharacterized protein n=1 Tax=Trichodelitschia bisporula TaxID=703511 RepID=A0A6G1HWA0_9PEZI|nr:hypothetical protein EJ06DRAFT_582077 [Trichodelitschia bisporula]